MRERRHARPGSRAARKVARWRATPSAGPPRLVLYPTARSGFIEYDRVLFFSDAVFAIAITLLAVELHVPSTAANIATSKELSHAADSLLGFGISFAVIALFWLGHHGMFRYITAIDRPLIILNLLFLGTIAFLPYPTSVLSVHSLSDRDAVIFYATCAGAAGLAEGFLWLYATRRGSGLTDASVNTVKWPYIVRIFRGPAVFAVSIPVAIVAPRVAPYTWILIFVTGLATRFAGRREPPGADREGDPQLRRGWTQRGE
ncbi:MAG TPA: TMEM175 family protein [Streptosporangiaceae bacterium]|nr:TMEM175 family protein [Streptosporangiaceae bacterium]